MSSEQKSANPTEGRASREALGIFLLALVIFLFLSLLSGWISSENWMGFVGKGLAQALYGTLGGGALFLLAALTWLGVQLLRFRSLASPHWGKMACLAGMAWLVEILLHMVSAGWAKSRGFNGEFFDQRVTILPWGGVLGEYSSELFRALLGSVGTTLVAVVGLAIGGIFVFSISYRGLWLALKAKLLRRGKSAAQGTADPVTPPADAGDLAKPDPADDTPVVVPGKTQATPKPPVGNARSLEVPMPDASLPRDPALDEGDAVPAVLPRFILTEPKKAGLNVPREAYEKTGQDAYQTPSLDLLDFKEQRQAELDRQAMLDLAQKLERSLLDYQVKGRVTQIHPGPVVTMYEFAPSPGTKLSKITALASDLAMALEALRVRIVAPIPGKAAVGIEVPNSEREMVFLKEILADETFSAARSKLTIALGKDISGLPVSVDLSKMPHLLIAGTTGSGKSVAVNVMICSLLFRATPDEVKLIMIDPKMLELSIYEGIPHLLLPVVTDPKKANLALKWAVDEMNRRYDVMSKTGVRDIAGYNRFVEEQQHPGVVAESGDAGSEEEPLLAAARKVVTEPLQKFPYIVVIIDEFADLMMVAAKEVEVSVARIAQKARAAGIHLVLATQRPSVDVITGLIKANFPSRIAFQVASRIDSRTILDTQGAEALLGMGDMLFTDRGQALRRVHGAFIGDGEVHKVVEHLKSQGRPIYDMSILAPRGEDDEEGGSEDDFADEMYDEAVRVVTESRQASISMVQRRLRIGYNRAARMIERMEREGIVSAPDGAKGREVLANAL